MTTKPPSVAALARAAKTSRVQVYRELDRGAPRTSTEAYLVWRRRNVVAAVRASSGPRPSRIDEVEREDALFQLSVCAIADDVHDAADPFWIRVEAEMMSRGASPEVAHEWAHELRPEQGENE
jgi:hypothetical protein